MATTGTYYLNGPDLISSTAVFTDSALTTCAPDGYYKQGLIVRQLVSCVLLPPQNCPACVDACDSGLIESNTEPGVFTVSLSTGTDPGDVGAIVITFNPLAAPDGIQVEFDGVIYNALSSPTYGYLAGTASMPTYIGATASDCGLVIDSPHLLDIWNWFSGAWQSPTSTEVVNITSGQLDLTGASPGDCVMVIPKLTGTPSVIDIKIISACPTNDFSMTVACPELLPSFPSTGVWETQESACVSIEDETYYSASVNGDGTTLGQFDWVFSDAYGQNVLPDGYYGSASCPPGFDIFFVENGVIKEFYVCP